MCGIFGYISSQNIVSKNSAAVCLEGLKLLQYRGYDSAGIAGIANGKIETRRAVGKIEILEELLRISKLKSNISIGHTRWATHGGLSEMNAHPHVDEKKTLALVHNGIVENHFSLRALLREQGVHFSSETDSEVIAQLVATHYEGDFLEAVQRSLPLLKGFWGLAIIHQDHPEQMIVTAKENPMIIARSAKTKECWISSDVNALIGEDLEVVFLKHGEIALVQPDCIAIFDESHSPIKKSPITLSFEDQTPSKNGFEHYMLKEIMEQPETILKAFHGRLSSGATSIQFENATIAPLLSKDWSRIVFLGCGTSWHAGCFAASLVEDILGIPATSEIASEFSYRNPAIDPQTLVVAISQSGETIDTLTAVAHAKSKGATILGICNVANSLLTREVDEYILLRAGLEMSVCSTKAYTSQIVVLMLMISLMASFKDSHQQDSVRLQKLLNELLLTPELAKNLLANREVIANLAEKYGDSSDFFFLGRHYMYTTALEAALKLKEISYLNAIGFAAGEMKHGPISLIDSESVVFGLFGNEKTFEKTLSNIYQVKSRGAKVIAICTPELKEQLSFCDDFIILPKLCDEVSSLLYSITCQLFAYYSANLRGCDIDQPRNLAKSVTVE